MSKTAIENDFTASSPRRYVRRIKNSNYVVINFRWLPCKLIYEKMQYMTSIHFNIEIDAEVFSYYSEAKLYHQMHLAAYL